MDVHPFKTQTQTVLACLCRLQAKWDLKQIVCLDQSPLSAETDDHRLPATRPNTHCFAEEKLQLSVTKSGLLGSRTAGLLLPDSLEEQREWANKRVRKCTAQNPHKHTRKGWHLIEDPVTAKALYSPQLAPSSDTHPKPSSGEPSLRFCFKEALMSFFFSSADMAFGCLTQHFVLL